ncbi:MAG: SsrA-binding protein SmpB [Dehalococcoidales bacterium]|nr:SsrA-binding protein SmpB [Dehalococcoidales bacterium]
MSSPYTTETGQTLFSFGWTRWLWYNLFVAIKTITTNRKAYHNYHIGESIEAGIVLTGSEIKSIRDGGANLVDAYVKPERGELWLLNAHIARYEAGSHSSHEPGRARKLLLHRKQIATLTGQVSEKGLTIIPLRLYIKDSTAKVEVALGKGKKLYDKREVIARRETEREMGRAVKRQTSGR